MIRYSIIDYLNALPLNLAFKDGPLPEATELIFDYPSQCADNLATRRADVGLISSIEYQRIPHLLVAPNVAIASKKKVRSVLLLTAKAVADVRVVALDRFSRSSVALLRILFQRRFGFKPRFVTMAPEPNQMLAKADAALIIGDAALRLPANRQTETGRTFEVIDLATQWFEMTGLPFVFAFWAAHPSVADQTVARTLLAAKAYGLQQIPHRLEQIQARWRLPAQAIQAYFRDNIHYDLGAPERESLQRFYRYAEEAGLIAQAGPLRFIE